MGELPSEIREGFRTAYNYFGLFSERTDENFNRVDAKYGVIHQEMMAFQATMKELVTALREDREEIKRISKGITKIADRLAPEA
ncbi:hypothetical protein HY095_01875 [Candidatus Micrarchaeota archaeon]|nr:hypothetical protein [Candidatus Micrarchaeota archaeon]